MELVQDNDREVVSYVYINRYNSTLYLLEVQSSNMHTFMYINHFSTINFKITVKFMKAMLDCIYTHTRHQ